MQIKFIGDVNGDEEVYLPHLRDIPTIQVGNLELHKMNTDNVSLFVRGATTQGNRRINDHYYVDGTCDQEQVLHFTEQNGPVIAARGLVSGPWLVRRGSMFHVGDPRYTRYTLFMGGGESAAPYESLGWQQSERIMPYDIHQALRNYRSLTAVGGTLSVMVTHTPPAFIYEKHLGVKPNSSSRLIQYLWEQVGCPKLFCGHINQSIVDGNVRVLAAGEVHVQEF